MLELELKTRTKEKIVYNFYPECDKSDGGYVEYSLTEGKIIGGKEAKRNWSAYISQACRQIKAFAKNGVFPDKYIVAWY